MVNESLDRATEARYIAAHGDTAQLRAFYRDQLRGSWFWTEELANLYTQYEADRRTYPTFASFMPRIIAYFDSLPDRVPAMQRRYDAQRPKIVSLSIASGSDSVDAGLKEIVIQFDRPRSSRATNTSCSSALPTVMAFETSATVCRSRRTCSGSRRVRGALR